MMRYKNAHFLYYFILHRLFSAHCIYVSVNSWTSSHVSCIVCLDQIILTMTNDQEDCPQLLAMAKCKQMVVIQQVVVDIFCSGLGYVCERLSNGTADLTQIPRKLYSKRHTYEHRVYLSVLQQILQKKTKLARCSGARFLSRSPKCSCDYLPINAYLQRQTNKKSYMIYRKVLYSIILNDPKLKFQGNVIIPYSISQN